MNIKDIITLIKAGYTKEEINETLRAANSADAAEDRETPFIAAAAEATPPEKQRIPADVPAVEDDPRIAELEKQIRELQAKLIQSNTVDTIPNKETTLFDIANTVINGGKRI